MPSMSWPRCVCASKSNAPSGISDRTVASYESTTARARSMLLTFFSLGRRRARPERRPDARRRHRQLVEPRPGRGRNGIRDRGRRTHDGSLADSLRAERPVRRWNLDDERFDLGNPFGSRDRVFEEGAAEQPPVLVVTKLLEERPAHALRDTSPHLALDEGGVQRSPDVLGDDVAEKLDLAGIPVHAD